LTAALASIPFGFAQATTTAPGAHAIVPVVLMKKAIAVGDGSRLPRGVFVSFYIRNLTKLTQNFTFLGKKTNPIKPGQTGVLTITLNRRGIFPYLSTLDRTRVLRGLFIVY
jgi:hypothetical protein